MSYRSPQIPEDDDNVEDTMGLVCESSEEREVLAGGFRNKVGSAFFWFRLLAKETHWSYVFGVISVYGVSQGLGGSISRVAVDYYWKDVQKVKPSSAQFYQGIINLPWMVKPLWGLMTDVLPMAGYHRRPYFVLAGILGIIAMFMISLPSELHVIFALISLTIGSAGVAIADVTIDACNAANSIKHPSLAADVQSLCGLSSSIGRLLGFCVSGLLVHAIGSQGVLGLLTIPSALVFLVGIMLKETHMPNFDYGEVYKKLKRASLTMWTTLKCPEVWRPCLYMYVSLALSLNIQEGLFFWYTDSKSGLSFSQEAIGFIFSIGSVGSLLGVLLYQNILKEYAFRNLLFWSQLLTGFAGMLDLIMVLRLNLKIGIPDYFFAVIDESISQMIGVLKWMPLLVMSSKLCPPGIEGTFFALLMSIDNLGLLTSSWGGGILLHLLKITRTEFGNLWITILVRNIFRLLPLALLFLVPKVDQDSTLLPSGVLDGSDNVEAPDDEEANGRELMALVDKTNY